MTSSDISEESSDWEEIQYPYSDHASSSSPKGQQLDLELVIRENFYDDGSSVFPPSEHEGLPLEPEECESPKNAALIPSPLLLPCSGTDPPQQEQIEADSKLSMIMGRVRVRMCTMWGKMSALIGTSFGPYPSPLIVPATALAVAVLACVKILRWRKQVLLLMREKDQSFPQWDLLTHTKCTDAENQPALESDSPHEGDLVSKKKGTCLEN